MSEVKEPLYKTTSEKIIQEKPSKFKLKRKKHVLSLFDTIVAISIITPLAIGFWRGTWMLMEIYDTAFPAWESYIFGMTLHLCFALMRGIFTELVECKVKTKWQIYLAFFLRRLYTYLFAVVCVLHWRCGWIIFDNFFKIKVHPNGAAIEGPECYFAATTSIGFMVMLMMLKSYRNILAVPFTIALDIKRTVFNFPTRFKVKVLYTAIYAINGTKIKESNDTLQNTSVSSTEKLTASQVSIEKQEIEHISPRPFINDLRGPSPSRFTPPYGPPMVHQAQGTSYRPTKHPNNIQDIIQYLTENAHRPKELIKEQQFSLNTNRDRYNLYGTFQGPKQNHNYFNQDPFFAFKPQDPSDINLLAPSNFRFAPALASSAFYKDRQQLTHEVEHVNDQVQEDVKKPLKLTLSIYPFRNHVQFPGPGIMPRHKYPMASPGRMIVHLNVYPGANNKLNIEPVKEASPNLEILSSV